MWWKVEGDMMKIVWWGNCENSHFLKIIMLMGWATRLDSADTKNIQVADYINHIFSVP